MGWVQPLVFLAGVIMGTASTISVKVLYGLQSIGMSGELERFEKPLFTTWIMFIGMMLSLPIHYIIQWYQHRDYYHAVYKGQTNHNHSEPERVPWRTFFILLVPSVFDLLGTGLASIGLLFTTVSVYQLVRCSIIIVTAVLKATVLKQQLSHYMWIGIGINTIAMIMVSLTSFMPGATAGPSAEADDGIDRDPRVGILFILLSCLVQGSQYVFEEKVMTVDNAPPLVVVGMEGVWGTLLMPLVVFPWSYILPGSDYGACVENFLDSWEMIMNSTAIQLMLLFFTIVVCLYNIFCIYVTFLLSSIWHAILDNFRPVSVWGFDLFLFYVITNGTFGEAWTIESWLEFAGMILLLTGTAVYNGTLLLPFIEYDIEEIEEIKAAREERESLLEDGTNAANRTGTPSYRKNLASPVLTRSPLINRQLRSLSPYQQSSSQAASSHQGSYRDANIEFGPPHLALNGGQSLDDRSASYGSTSSSSAAAAATINKPIIQQQQQHQSNSNIHHSSRATSSKGRNGRE